MMPAVPLLKWAGGKRRIAGAVLAAFGDGPPARLVVPFVGGGAVMLAARARWPGLPVLAGDASPQLIACYRSTRDTPDDVIGELAALPVDGGWRAAYGPTRDEFNAAPVGGPRQAARMIWLNRAGYGGLWRVNGRGDLNVSADTKAARVALPSPDAIRAWSAAVQGVAFDVGDAVATIARAVKIGPPGWIYADPPYLPITPSSFTTYSGAFDLPDHRRLSGALGAAAAMGWVAVLSNADAPALGAAYPASDGAHVVDRIGVRRTISVTGDRTLAREVLIRYGGGAP